MGTFLECLVNVLFVSICHKYSLRVMEFIYLSPWWHGCSLWVAYKSSICLYDVTATHCECLVNRLFVSMMSQLLIVSVLSIVFFCPWCNGYSLWVSCQSSIYLHYVNDTHSICLAIRLLVSIVLWVLFGIFFFNHLFTSLMAWLLIVSVLSIVFLSLLFVSVLSIVCFSPWCHWYSLWVSCQSSNCPLDVTGTHLEYLINSLLDSIMSEFFVGSVLSFVMTWVLIWSFLLIIRLSPWCHRHLFRVSCQSSKYMFPLCQWLLLGVFWQSYICLNDVTDTKWGNAVAQW